MIASGARSALPIAALTLVAALAAAHDASAQVSIEASPLRVEIQTQPGGASTQSVTLNNIGNDRVRVRTTVSDWFLSRDGAPQFEEPADGRKFAASGWVRFAPPEFVLDGGQQGTVRFTVSVPMTAEPGGYRSGLLFEFAVDGGDPLAGRRQVNVRGRIATLIYVHVGQPAPSVELTRFRVQSTADDTEVVATLKNSSRRSVRTKGTVMLYDRAGLVVRQIAVPDVPVLPESERDVALTTPDVMKGLPAGDYRVELKIDVGQPTLIVGETTLKVAG